MALDQIWKQQLTLVSYGNAFLTTQLGFDEWIEHPIFNQSHLSFRDLHTQHLLAQHFQIWLEGLQKQGVKKLSLHLSTLLNDEQNPNANVELLPFTHFIVSHQGNKKTAWICGRELAEWYEGDNEFDAPLSQKSTVSQNIFWRYSLNDKLAQKIDADLQKLNWNEVHTFLQRELFHHPYTQDFLEPEPQDRPFYGYELDPNQPLNQQLALIPISDPINCSHSLLHRTHALMDYLALKRQHPYNNAGELISPEEQINLRHFSEKVEDLLAKLIVKIANHYQTAYLTIESQPQNTHTEPEIIDRTMEISQPFEPVQHHKVSTSSVIKLVLFAVILCVCAYYFGF